jgi:hypothetical protein
MMRFDLSRHAPPGFVLRPERRFFLAGMACAVLYSLGFLGRFFDARTNLYRYEGTKRVLLPGTLMPDFYVLLDNALIGFVVLALCMLVFILWHYLYHRQNSKSIYLMRRLPKRWELHRRCLTLPLAAVLLCLLAAGLLLLVYYWIYMAATPDVCLTPQQWQKLWSVLR